MTEQLTPPDLTAQEHELRAAPSRTGRTARALTLATAVLVLAFVAVGYVRFTAESEAAAPSSAAVSLAPGPQLLTLMSNGQITTVPKDDPSGPRTVSQDKCDRIYAAAGTVACLLADGVLGTVKLRILGPDLALRKAIPINGIPNRVRVSASGRMLSWTTFVGGDDYASLNFSTRTGIYDTTSGTLLKSLESFAVTREGKPYRNVDVNYWGVTFTEDDNTFYATLYTDGHRYLVQGDVRARTVRTLRKNVECPSLSPDGTRIAFKEAIDADPARGWRLSVLDLASGRVTPTSETRSVDDQAAWLDNSTLAYVQQHGDGTKDLWTVAADGSAKPALLLRDASSPAALG